MSKNPQNSYRITRDYRDRWSKLPKGEYDLKKDEMVTLIHNPGIGSLIVEKEDGTRVPISGFSGCILQIVRG